MPMVHVALFIVGALFLVFVLAGFFRSFWREAPRVDGSSPPPDRFTGGFPSDHHGGGDHGGVP
jgi:hypothetical protein